MSFLLDTDTCSVHLKRPSGLVHRFVQHGGGLHISTITLAELYVWAYQRLHPAKLLDQIEHELLPDIIVIDFDSNCAKEFGRVRAVCSARESPSAAPTL